MVKRYFSDFIEHCGFSGNYGSSIQPLMSEDKYGGYVQYNDYAALEARVAELEKDAARYRFIADQHSLAWEADLDEQMSREA